MKKKTFRIDWETKTVETHSMYVEASDRQEAQEKWASRKPHQKTLVESKRLLGGRKVKELKTNRKSPK